MRSSDVQTETTMNSGLRIRVVGLGAWGTRAAELFASHGIPAHAVDTDPRVAKADLPEAARHHLQVPGGSAADYTRGAEALSGNEGLGLALAGSEDDLLVLIGHLGSGAGALLGTLVRLAAHTASAAGRLAIARLPGVQSTPDDRAVGLVALNALVESPETSIVLVQPKQGMGISAESEAGQALERLLDLLRLGGESDAMSDISPASLLAHLTAPGFVGWREVEVDRGMCAEDAPVWTDSLRGTGVGWQPEGFTWADAQAVLPIARLPRDWIEAGGRAQFDRFVQEAWSEAAPCAIARSLEIGEPPFAMIVSTGLSYPESLLEIRDSVQVDRERLAEKRRAAATRIPLGDDFLPRGVSLGTAPPAPSASRPVEREPRRPDDSGPVRPAPRPMPEAERPPAQPHAALKTTHPARPRPELDAEVAALTDAVPAFDAGTRQTEFDEVRLGVATATETDVEETGVDADADVTQEAVAEIPEPEIAADQRPAELVEPPRSETAVTEDEEAAEEAAEAPYAPSPAEPAPRLEEGPTLTPYEAALSLAWRVLNAGDLETEVDLGEIRYALYDLLEVVREQPSSILAEVFRRTERDYFERHHVNVAVLALLTADQLGATLSDVIDLGTAAMLHDIGMSDSREAWDADVRLAPKVFDTTIRQHPERGQERLKQIPGMTPDISRIVREEHERLDGTGYPDGLAGDAIDPGARIVAVCDTLEALTHARPYRERLTLGEALSRLHILGQYTLDMAVVQTLTDALTEFMPSLDGSDEA
ncbi:MAG TPA: HD domain-containing phosphohydrolase [Gemmatimonadota bacterium]|nr:HD domain-containing phosphohydrolase [Gemmatimonadota bacterium]